MSNKGMTLTPRSPGRCPTCGNEFQKQIARETYCSMHCAVWSKVETRAPDECWPWTGGLVGGYGAGTFARKRYRATRFILSQRLGQPLDAETFALHRCDNPKCCNPAHLFPGTNADNMADKTRKGRGRSVSPKLKGEAHGRARLTEAQVMDIWNNRPNATAMSKKYGVPKGTTHGIMRGKNWAWLTQKNAPLPK